MGIGFSVGQNDANCFRISKRLCCHLSAKMWDNVITSQCAACGRADENLKLCGGCKIVKYCDRDCQIAHRKIHKNVCRKVTKPPPSIHDPQGAIVLIGAVQRFIEYLMFPLLGSPDPKMYEVLFPKKGAKERINEHMMNFFTGYVSLHPECLSQAAISRVLSFSQGEEIEEPILVDIQKELYRYLKEEEGFLM